MLLALKFIEVYNMQTDPMGSMYCVILVSNLTTMCIHMRLLALIPQWEMTLYVMCVHRVVFCVEITGSGRPAVRDLLASLEYGPAPESPAVVEAWLEDHERSLGHFIGNQWVKPEGRKSYSSYNPATGALLATTVQGTCNTHTLGIQYILAVDVHDIKGNTGNCNL